MRAKLISLLLTSAVLAGCQSAGVNTSYNSNYSDFDRNAIVAPSDRANRSLPAQADDLWQVTRDNLQFAQYFEHPKVVHKIDFYNRYPAHMKKVSKRATPYYHYVLQEVLKRGYPSEIALVPVVESLYNPHAVSPGKAAGVWQFIPSTATYLGLDINDWYDGRRDIISSTQTALDYLARYHKRFDGDWMLALAAYNAGGGTVSSAIRRNKKAGKPTDYFSLDLPQETREYVPRILAIAALVDAPQKYAIDLPTIPNEPFFKVVDSGGQIALDKVADMSGVSSEVLRQLNPGFKRQVTAPTGPHRLLVPIARAPQLTLALGKLDKSERLNWNHYTVKSGDSLSVIAQRFGTTSKMIRQSNNMSSSKIRI
ncbi:MAG: transglycosylase SLT domain-containing protein, partial [Pseudomonadales bacterium]